MEDTPCSIFCFFGAQNVVDTLEKVLGLLFSQMALEEISTAL